MDRAYITRQLTVAINGEPMLAEASDDYKAQMVIDWTHHLAGNWEQMELWKTQIAARKAALEKEGL